MKFSQYIKDKWLTLFISMLAICTSGIFMVAVGVALPIIWAVNFIFGSSILLCLGWDFLKRKNFYTRVAETFQELDEKSYLTSLIERPTFFDGKFLYDLLKKDEKYLNDKVAEQRQDVLEYKEYVQTWVHEVKTPIATSKLIAENHRDRITLSMEEEVDKIESLVEQMLYYTKSESVEEDYRIKSVSLKEMVSAAVRKNAKAMIEAKIAPHMSGLEVEVLADAKWMEFVIGQLLENAVKYRAVDRAPLIELQTEVFDDEVKLIIADNGIGIPETDLHRVLKKGYTGENGRKYKKSTGMGLYLSKKLCDKMGIGMELLSETGKGTEISLRFKRTPAIEI